MHHNTSLDIKFGGIWGTSPNAQFSGAQLIVLSAQRLGVMSKKLKDRRVDSDMSFLTISRTWMDAIVSYCRCSWHSWASNYSLEFFSSKNAIIITRFSVVTHNDPDNTYRRKSILLNRSLRGSQQCFEGGMGEFSLSLDSADRYSTRLLRYVVICLFSQFAWGRESVQIFVYIFCSFTYTHGIDAPGSKTHHFSSVFFKLINLICRGCSTKELILSVGSSLSSLSPPLVEHLR